MNTAPATRTQQNIRNGWTVRGPALWRQLHRWALTTDRKDVRGWLDRFTMQIGCGDCKRHWQKVVWQQPPDASSNQALFAWSVRMHNAVNRRLGRAETSLAAAEARWKGEQS